MGGRSYDRRIIMRLGKWDNNRGGSSVTGRRHSLLDQHDPCFLTLGGAGYDGGKRKCSEEEEFHLEKCGIKWLLNL
jgi:hypothetical protein